MKKLLFLLLLLPFFSRGQEAPVLGLQEVFRDTLVATWTSPATSTATQVQRSSSRDFATTTTTVFDSASGGRQIAIERGLTQHTWYYYRARSGYPGSVWSQWKVDSVRTFWTPTASSQGGHRIATSADLALDPFINVGDYLIVGSDSYPENDLWGAGVGGYSGLQVPKLAVGAKVCIMGDIGYDYITLDMSLNTQGTDASPVIITNIGGQVKARINFGNMKHVLFTGKYDPVKKTGNARYLGFDKADWSVLNGSFGFYAKGRWDHPGQIITHMHGDTDSSTVEYIETGEGGYSGMTIKNDGGTIPMKGITLRYLYTHDTGGEGYYIGSTQAEPQMPVVNFTMHNCVVVRSGLNGIQFGQMLGSSSIHNNVFAASGFEVFNSFMKYQDQAIQPSMRRNGVRLRYNMVPGTAGDFINSINAPQYSAPSDTAVFTDTSVLSQNYFADSKSWGGGYINSKGRFLGHYYIDSNYLTGLGRSNAAYAVIFPNDVTPHDYGFQWELLAYDSPKPPLKGKITLHSRYNSFDASGFQLNPQFVKRSTTPDSILMDTAFNRPMAIPRARFSNYMDMDSAGDYSAAERWVALYCTQWNQYSRFGTKFQTIRDNNASSSTTTLAIPTTHPSVITLTVGTGKAYRVGEQLDFTSGANTWRGTITAYNSATGSVTVNSVSNTGTGTFSSWTVQQWIESIMIDRVYNTGDIVRHESRFYKSLQNNNVNHQPTGGTDSWWKLIVFSNGRCLPPDDFRLKTGDFYAQKGFGLNSIIGPITPSGRKPNFFKVPLRGRPKVWRF
jgi:hypothetical protein